MAQKKYTVIGFDAGGAASSTASNGITVFNLIGASNVRPRIYEFDVSSNVAPVDQNTTVAVGRTTAVGTAGSSPTPQPLDNQEMAAITTAGITHANGNDPTYSANYLFQVPLNNRATFRWIAAPDSEFICTATASNGLAMKRYAGTATYVIVSTVFFFE